MKFMYTLDDILDEGLKFQNSMFISLHNLYIVHTMKYSFLNCLAWLMVPLRWYLALAAYNGCYAWLSLRHKAMYDVTDALWRHMVRGRIEDFSNDDLPIVGNNQFTNLIE